jgi:hypothetical protein
MQRQIANCLGALIGVLAVSVLSPAQAQQPTPAQTDAVRQSCRSDFMADCTGVQPGTREALQCLQHNVAKLSPSCKTAVRATMPAPPPAAAAPAPPPPPAVATAPSPPPAAAAPAPAVGPLKADRSGLAELPGDTRIRFVETVLRRDRLRQREIAPGRWAYPGPAI